ncbi:alanine--tRNA ligase [bacterium]|jgi:alanyl-tRNA synthetase|nr:alanine--tRNA ligase [bacterium]MBT6832088.1 alanine--tRNA ligase [bacterium]MBT6995869.1 alanine--tRNA ligase [bacterium]MBT7772606.1 alanine--tRNA ligase [bacterium]
MKITTDDLRKKWLDFWREKNHAIIPSAGVLPENDPTALFHNSGMHPLVPYLSGEKHPAGTRLANFQKCVRTGDIDEVGDATHLTFFEMLGNWSLGDYFKKEQIAWSFEFLTETLKLPLAKLAVSVFAGDDDAPRDAESAEFWGKSGVPKSRIAFLGKSENWWKKGDTGPCGTDTEMFFWTGDEPAPEDFQKTHDDPHWVEIWNDVFMTFDRKSDGSLENLPQKNVDTGMGLERTVAILNGKKSVFETDAFAEILEKIAELSGHLDVFQNPTAETELHFSARILADHIRTATIILGDRVAPSNTDQGYILRRLIRRAVRHGMKLGITENLTLPLAEVVIEKLGKNYPELEKNNDFIFEEIVREEDQFRKTLISGEREFEKLADKILDAAKKHDAPKKLAGKKAFWLYETYGFPFEMTAELCAEKDLEIDRKSFDEAEKKHAEMSRAGAEQKFKGGLGDTTDATVKLHTAAHLMVAGLRKVLGDHVEQRGSNITPERLRFDFSHDEKMTDDQKSAVEKFVNDAIAADAEQSLEEIPKVDAENDPTVVGAFWEKYPDTVKIFTFKDDAGKTWSRELCGGPHWQRTGDLGIFKIKKEESSSRGVRRIKAILEN